MMDPAIKLFGKTIPVIGEGDGEESMRYDSNDSSYSEHQELDDKELAEDTMEIEQSDDTTPRSEEDSTNPPAMQSAKNNEKPAYSEKESEEKESDDLKNPQQKPLKKPDKILPCPRCNSLDTKFCYYNNYNINQPRHFCKSCQRYWTAGGTMRNVPVGAGRRKNKSSASRYCHITVSEALQAARLDIPNGVHHHPGLKSNGTVLTFGSDNPLCESMAPVLNIGDHNSNNNNNKKAPKNGFHKIDQGYCRSKETGCDDRSSGSTITTTSSMDDKVKVGPQGQIKPNNMNNNNGFTTNQMPCFQWPYMWNPAVPMPPFCPSAPFPMSFYPHPPPPPPPPPPYWNGAMPWNFPWVPQCSPNQKGLGSNPSSPTLGKHTREGEMVNQSYQEKSTVTPTVLVPKTLRIDDPDEAAKSSIWSTLGIKKGDSLSKGGFFNSLPPKKAEEKIHNMDTPTALKANPAALCRSMNFEERA